MQRAEQQLRLIQGVYEVEVGRHSGEDLEQLRARCEGLPERTAPLVAGNDHLKELLADTWRQVRTD
jgi:hypothetical protein